MSTKNPGENSPSPDLLFYDGHCGLCHRAVLFALRRDDGSRFAFAPLQGETFRQQMPPEIQVSLPDSLVVLAEGRVLVKSEAVLRMLNRIGGGWGALARLGGWLPRGLRDRAYDLVASIRHRLFSQPESACPILPSNLRKRFLP